MTISRVRSVWTGLNGLPGYTFFYYVGNTGMTADLPIFWDSIKQFLPTPLAITIDNVVTEIDEKTGKMTGTHVGNGGGIITGTGSTAYVAQAGAQVKWYTGGFNRGRKVVGRTYLVPLQSTAWGSGGLIQAATCNTINAAADVLRSRSGGTLCVWSRPVFVKDANGKPTDVIEHEGSTYVITSTAVPTKSVTQNRRRDP